MELNELRKIAEAATPGPWKWEEPSKYEWPMEDQSLIQSEGNESILSGWGYDASGTLAEDVDRTHIATFDPPTVLALLSRLEQAEQGRAQAVADYEAAELKLLHVRDLSKYLKKLAPGDKHYAGLIDRALDGDGRG